MEKIINGIRCKIPTLRLVPIAWATTLYSKPREMLSILSVSSG